MKKVLIFSLLIFLMTGFSACKKDKIEDEITNNENHKLPSAKEERALLDDLQTMAKDIEIYYEGIDNEIDWEAKYNRIRKNMHARINEVAAKADIVYNNNEGKRILAINSYVLMSYHFLEKYMSEFMWTKLGLFAANDVRFGLTLSYAMREGMSLANFNFPIDGFKDLKAQEAFYKSTVILIEGQINVFTDIGALGLLSHKYGPETFINEQWLTQEARNGYEIQKQAEDALAIGNIDEYQDLQTEAAIWFGAHEQLYTLAPVWDNELMGVLAELNINIHKTTFGEMALFGDLFIGVNKLTQGSQGYMIKLPMAHHDLRKGEDRVGIAMNGFRTLNRLRKDPKWKDWVEKSENMLGDQKGIYNIKGFMP